MLGKGILDIVKDLELGQDSQLFIVYKVAGHQLYLHQVCHPNQLPDGDSFVGVGVNQERGCHVLDQPQGRCFQIPIHWVS